jgi:hypothetical protein
MPGEAVAAGASLVEFCGPGEREPPEDLCDHQIRLAKDRFS